MHKCVVNADRVCLGVHINVEMIQLSYKYLVCTGLNIRVGKCISFVFVFLKEKQILTN